MKNNLLGVNLEKSLDGDDRLVVSNDLLELIVMNKMQRGDFDDIVEQMTAALGPEYDHPSDCEDCDCCDECDERESLTAKAMNLYENHSRKLVCAGYMDCMDEAIRFLVEEENISPEHPVVRNLKAHLEQSKERVLETASDSEFRNNDKHHSRTAQDHVPFLVRTPCAWNTG